MTNEDTNLAGQDNQIADEMLNQVAGGRVRAVAEGDNASLGVTKSGVVLLGTLAVIAKRKGGLEE